MTELYEQDFYAWITSNAESLRNKKFDQLDIENLAEELETMGRSEKRALVSHLSILIAHLLKWQGQPDKRSKSWESTIREQRKCLLELLDESPSLKPLLASKWERAYEKGLVLASQETKLTTDSFTEFAFTLDKALDDKFLPD